MAGYKSNIWKLYVMRFLLSLHFFTAVFVPFFTDYIGITLSQVLFIQAWFTLAIFFLEIPTGTIADKFGRKKSLLMASISTVIAILIYSYTKSFSVLLIAETFWALGVSLASGSYEAMVYDTLKDAGEEKKSKKVFGRVGVVERTGYLVAGTIGGFIAGSYGLFYPMFLTAIPMGLAFFIGLSLKEPDVKLREKNYSGIFIKGVKNFFNNKVLKILALDLIVVQVLVFSMLWLYQPLMSQKGLDVRYFGLVFAAFVLGEILVLNSFSKLEKLLGSKKRLLFITAMLSGVGLVAAGLAGSLALAIISIIITLAFGLTRKPLFDSYMNKYIESDKRATVLSTVSMGISLLSAVVWVLVGITVEWSLNYTLVALGVLVITFTLFSKIEEKHLID